MLEEKKRYIIDFKDIPGERAHMPQLPARERVGTYEEIEKGFSPEQAQQEARRCLSCRRCLGCKLCLAACEKDAIVFDQADETLEIEVDSIIITPGIIQNQSPLEEGFGYGKSPNVLTDLEFEGMLHDQGPYGGMILRPSDGEVPDKIGFIYCDEKGHNRNALVFLLKEIAAAAKKIEGSELWLFTSYIPEGSETGASYREQVPSLICKRSVPEAVVALEESRTLVLHYREEGEKRTERFQMIVIATRRKLSDSIKKVGEQLGLRLSQNVDASEDSSKELRAKGGIVLVGGIATR